MGHLWSSRNQYENLYCNFECLYFGTDFSAFALAEDEELDDSRVPKFDDKLFFFFLFDLFDIWSEFVSLIALLFLREEFRVTIPAFDSFLPLFTSVSSF